MSTLEEKLKEIEARFQNTRPRTLSNAVEWYSAYADLEALIAMLRKCREQRDAQVVEQIVANNTDSELSIPEQLEEANALKAEYDAELLALAKGGQ